ncbi:MAG: 2Fe-2S iron-sulfur cluster binding domain-containing protein [Verrucomicrobia bacterium]|nr:2Fe-2S iron-sulfur cluster binding domain-containing protein [Verrucomicrobiota bacterium]
MQSETGPQETPSFGHLSRRTFLSRLGASSAAAAIANPLLGLAQTQPKQQEANSPVTVAGGVPVTLRVNGQQHQMQIDPRSTLLDCLRENLHLTGTKKGCDHGQCGACTVHINGRRINSCLTFAAMHQGEEITTIEGIGQPDNLHPVQAAFVKHDGYQCGYCTSGQIMSAVALLVEPCGPTDADVQELMSGNICRCGAYRNIIAAIREVRQAAKLGGTNASL